MTVERDLDLKPWGTPVARARNGSKASRELLREVMLLRERDGLTYAVIGARYRFSAAHAASLYARACARRRFRPQFSPDPPGFWPEPPDEAAFWHPHGVPPA